LTNFLFSAEALLKACRAEGEDLFFAKQKGVPFFKEKRAWAK
jgi:hypothetical protein